MVGFLYIAAIIAGLIVVIWSIPFVVYYSAKLGAFGYRCGIRRFEQIHRGVSDEKEQASTREN